MFTSRKSALFVALSIVLASTSFTSMAVAQIGTTATSDTTYNPTGQHMIVSVSSPWKNETVTGHVTIKASAKNTALTVGGIAYWAIYNSGNLVQFEPFATSSISVPVALTTGWHTIKIEAIDWSGTPSTVKIPVDSTSSGVHVKWEACIEKYNGNLDQAMHIYPKTTITGVLQGQLFYGSGCNPAYWTDQLNDFGTSMTFPAGSGWTFSFVNRPNKLGTSAVWTINGQSSGCVNYSTAPAC